MGIQSEIKGEGGEASNSVLDGPEKTPDETRENEREPLNPVNIDYKPEGEGVMESKVKKEGYQRKAGTDAGRRRRKEEKASTRNHHKERRIKHAGTTSRAGRQLKA